MKAVVLAGGRGTRLRSRVSSVPKPMATINGRPFLEYLFDLLIAADVPETAVSVGYMGEHIIQHFGDRYRSTKLIYAKESQPLGTGGGIVNALHHMGAEQDVPVLAVNGDTILKLDYAALMNWFTTSNHDMGVVLSKVSDVGRFGAVQLADGRIAGFSEKSGAGSGLINGGVYIFRPRILSRFAHGANFSIEQDFLQKYYRSSAFGAFVTEGFFHDIGTPDAFDDAQRLFRCHLA